MVISQLTAKIRDELLDNAAFEAREIVMKALGLSRSELIIRSNESLSPKEIETAFNMAKRRRLGEPLQYILGSTEFMSLEFEVNPDTLIPRSDTESLVEETLKYARDGMKILDIGTGSGCIGISIGKYAPAAKITLADISEGALRTAKRNAEKNKVAAECIRLDILNETPKGKFDIIVSNPPYIRSDVIPTLQTEVKDYEPHTALDGGRDGLVFYRRITEIAPKILNGGGYLFFEIGFDQGGSVAELMQKDFCGTKIIKDLCGNDRVVMGKLR